MSAVTFIQWKGTDVCMDFTCECGAGCHIDAEFCYYVRCRKCGATWKMPWYVYPTKVEDSDEYFVEELVVSPMEGWK